MIAPALSCLSARDEHLSKHLYFFKNVHIDPVVGSWAGLNTIRSTFTTKVEILYFHIVGFFFKKSFLLAFSLGCTVFSTPMWMLSIFVRSDFHNR